MKESQTTDIVLEMEDPSAAAEPDLKEKTAREEKRLETLIAVFLGITALLVAWATWIGSVHSGNQMNNYTCSSNYASAGTSEYNAALQHLIQDMML